MARQGSSSLSTPFPVPHTLRITPGPPCACLEHSFGDVCMYYIPHTHATHACTQTAHVPWLDQGWGSRGLERQHWGWKMPKKVLFASGWASLPTHRAPVTAHGEEGPPSRTQGTFLFAWLHLHNLSEKSTVSPFSLPLGRLWQSVDVLCTRSVKWKKSQENSLGPSLFLLTLGMHFWFESRKKEMPYCFLSTSLTLLGILFASLDHLSCRPAWEEKALWWQENPAIPVARMPSNGNAKDTR